MRPYSDYPEEHEGFDDFSFDRTQALGKLIRAHRREERIRHENQDRDFNKGRIHHNEWDWDDDDDYESYVDDDFSEYYENRNGSHTEL